MKKPSPLSIADFFRELFCQTISTEKRPNSTLAWRTIGRDQPYEVYVSVFYKECEGNNRGLIWGEVQSASKKCICRPMIRTGHSQIQEAEICIKSLRKELGL